jgi:hypothetical protein
LAVGGQNAPTLSGIAGEGFSLGDYNHEESGRSDDDGSTPAVDREPPTVNVIF